MSNATWTINKARNALWAFGMRTYTSCYIECIVYLIQLSVNKGYSTLKINPNYSLASMLKSPESIKPDSSKNDIYMRKNISKRDLLSNHRCSSCILSKVWSPLSVPALGWENTPTRVKLPRFAVQPNTIIYDYLIWKINQMTVNRTKIGKKFSQLCGLNCKLTGT